MNKPSTHGHGWDISDTFSSGFVDISALKVDIKRCSVVNVKVSLISFEKQRKG